MFDDIVKTEWEQFEADFLEAMKDIKEIKTVEQFTKILENYLERII